MTKFFDLHLHAYPEIEATPEEMLRVAKRYGYAGIAITNHDHVAMANPAASIFSGVEICAKSVAELKRRIKEYSGKVDVLAVHGGDESTNMAALKDPRIDILAHPVEGKGKLNHVLVRYAAENGIAIEFSLDAIIHNTRSGRARILQKTHRILQLTRKYKAKSIITSNARSIYDIRAPREMIALASLFGMRREEAVNALSYVPESIINKKWKKERTVEIIGYPGLGQSQS
jgi:ribonuclease P/MRP protein subunit RPP1